MIDQLRPDGTIARLAQLSGAGAVVAGDADALYALDYLGGRIARVRADGAVEPFAEGLTRPVALAVLGEAPWSSRRTPAGSSASRSSRATP